MTPVAAMAEDWLHMSGLADGCDPLEIPSLVEDLESLIWRVVRAEGAGAAKTANTIGWVIKFNDCLYFKVGGGTFWDSRKKAHRFPTRQAAWEFADKLNGRVVRLMRKGVPSPSEEKKT